MAISQDEMEKMSLEEVDAAIANLQGTSNPLNVDAINNMSLEEVDDILAKQYGIGGPASFGESLKKGVEGVIPAFGRTAMGIATIAEDKWGFETDALKEYGEDVIQRSKNRLAAMPMRDKTTFRDVEDTFDKEGFFGTLPTFGQYAKEVMGEQIPNFGAFAGSYGAGSLVTRAVAGSAFGPIGGVTAAVGGFLLPHFFGNNAERKQEVKGEGYELTSDDYMHSLKWALAQTPLAVLSDRILLGFGPTAKLLEGGGLFSRVVLNATAGAAIEAPTEIGEQLIERHQAGLSIDDEEAVEEYREVGAAAGLFGSVTKGTTSAGEYLLQADRDKARNAIKDDETTKIEKENLQKDAYETGQRELPGLDPVTEEQKQRHELVIAFEEAKAKDAEVKTKASLDAVAKAQEALDNFDKKQYGKRGAQYDLFDENLNREIDRNLDPSVQLRDKIRKKAKKLEEQRKKQGKKEIAGANKNQLATPAVWKYLRETKLYGGGEEFVKVIDSGEYTGKVSGAGDRITLTDLKEFLSKSTGIDKQAFEEKADGKLDIDFKEEYEASRKEAKTTDEEKIDETKINIDERPPRQATTDEQRADELDELFGERYPPDKTTPDKTTPDKTTPDETAEFKLTPPIIGETTGETLVDEAPPEVDPNQMELDLRPPLKEHIVKDSDGNDQNIGYLGDIIGFEVGDPDVKPSISPEIITRVLGDLAKLGIINAEQSAYEQAGVLESYYTRHEIKPNAGRNTEIAIDKILAREDLLPRQKTVEIFKKEYVFRHIQELVDKETKAREKDQIREAKKTKLKSDIDDYRTRPFIDVKDLEENELIRSDILKGAGESGIDPRFFKRNAESIEKLNNALDALEQQFSDGLITSSQYDQQRATQYKRFSRLPAPLEGLSTQQVADFVINSEENSGKGGYGTYQALENFKEDNKAALRHLGGDIAASTFTNKNLNDADAVNLVTKEITNFGVMGNHSSSDATTKLFFPNSGNRFGKDYYNSLTDEDKTFVIQAARQYRKHLKRSVKGRSSVSLSRKSDKQIEKLRAKLDAHNAAKKRLKQAENAPIGSEGYNYRDQIVREIEKSGDIQADSSYIDPEGKRVAEDYAVGAKRLILELEAQRDVLTEILDLSFRSDLSGLETSTEILEKNIRALEKQLEETDTAKAYDAGKISLEEFKVLESELHSQLETQREILANNQTDVAGRIDPLKNELFDEIETPLPSPGSVFTKEERNFIENHFNPFVGKTIAFNKNIAKELKKGFPLGYGGEEKSYRAAEVYVRSSQLYKDIAKTFGLLIKAKNANNIPNDVFLQLLLRRTPDLIVDSTTSYAPINLMDTLIEPYAKALTESEFAALTNKLETQVGEDAAAVKRAVKKLSDLNRSKIKYTTNEKTLEKISELLGISEKEVAARVIITELPLEGMPAGAGGAVINGKAYLFTNNIQEGNEISTFMHEVGVHIGMNKLLGGNFNALYKRIEAFRKDPKFKGTPERTIAKRAFERFKYAESILSDTFIDIKGKPATRAGVTRKGTPKEKLKKQEIKEIQKEELVAYFVEEAVKFGINPLDTKNAKNFADSESLKNWFTQFMASMVDAIKEIFGLSINLNKKREVVDISVIEDEKGRGVNADDIVNLAYGAAKLGMVDAEGIFFKINIKEPTKSHFDLKGTRLSHVNQQLMLSIPSEGEAAGRAIFGGIDQQSKGDLLPIADEHYLTKTTDMLLDKPQYLVRGWYSLLGLNHLADTVRRFSPSFANAIEKLEQASALKRRLIEDWRGKFRDDIIKIKLLQEKESVADIKKFNRITNQSTLADKEGNRYDLREHFRTTPDPRVVNSALYKEFLTLPENLQIAYKIIVDGYENAGTEYKESLIGLMTDTVSMENVETINNLKAELADPDTLDTRRLEIANKLDEIDAKILSARQKVANALFKQGEITPFIPLVRRGRFWIKEEGEPDTSPSYAFETMGEAKRARTYLKKIGVKLVKGGDGDTIFERVGNEQIIYGDLKNSGAILEVMKAVRKGLGQNPNDISNQKVESILQDVQELYLASQPRESLMQQWRNRREIPGFEENALQNFAHMGMKYSNQIAMLQTNPKINDVYGEIKNIVAPEGRAGSKFATVLATLQGRKDFLLDPTPVGWAANAAYGGYSWFILGNISSAIVNLTQLPLVGYGLMAGEFGHTEAAKALKDAFGLYAAGGRDNNTELKFYGYAPTGPRSVLSLQDRTLFADESKAMNPEHLKKFGLTKQEMDNLYSTALSRSVVRRSSAQELQDVRRGTVDQFTGHWAKAELGLGWFFQNSERMNREIGLVAAYMLAKKKYKKATEEQLINRALQIVEDINGPALSETGPEILQDSWGKALGVFKKFAFSQIYLQWKLLRDMFSVLKKIERNPNLPAEMPPVHELAFRQFRASFIPAIAFAGLRGMPFFGAISLMRDLLYDMIGDEDEPDTDMATREAVGDIFYRGPASHFLNIDFASRTGFYQLAFRDNPYRRAQIGTVPFALESLGGPVYSMLRAPDRALDYWNKGESTKAIETMLPSFLRNPLKATRFANEGALNSKGYPIVDNVNEYNVALQVLGWSPNDLANQYQKNEFLTERQRDVYDTRQSLLTKYFMANRMNDIEEIRDIRKKIGEFNQRDLVRKMGRPITGDTIERSMDMRNRKFDEAIGGIVLPIQERQAILKDLGYD